ncbi:hypothetical protein LTR28_005577 [Elasticomyces elasticus]|nr:hypothetical protein LTR28_005577 [Elasticomyces elasticus]
MIRELETELERFKQLEPRVERLEVENQRLRSRNEELTRECAIGEGATKATFRVFGNKPAQNEADQVAVQDLNDFVASTPNAREMTPIHEDAVLAATEIYNEAELSDNYGYTTANHPDIPPSTPVYNWDLEPEDGHWFEPMCSSN